MNFKGDQKGIVYCYCYLNHPYVPIFGTQTSLINIVLSLTDELDIYSLQASNPKQAPRGFWGNHCFCFVFVFVFVFCFCFFETSSIGKLKLGCLQKSPPWMKRWGHFLKMASKRQYIYIYILIKVLIINFLANLPVIWSFAYTDVNNRLVRW